MSDVKRLYRYNDSLGAHEAEVYLSEVMVVKETPRGYWYCWNELMPKKYWRWVSNDGRRRKYYPTKKEAWESYKIRKRRQLEHLSSQLELTKIRLEYAKSHDEPPEDKFTCVGPHDLGVLDI